MESHAKLYFALLLCGEAQLLAVLVSDRSARQGYDGRLMLTVSGRAKCVCSLDMQMKLNYPAVHERLEFARK